MRGLAFDVVGGFLGRRSLIGLLPPELISRRSKTMVARSPILFAGKLDEIGALSLLSVQCTRWLYEHPGFPERLGSN